MLRQNLEKTEHELTMAESRLSRYMDITVDEEDSLTTEESDAKKSD